MAAKLIELADGTLVEVEVLTEHAQQISGGFADKVSATFDKVIPLIKKICYPIAMTCKEMNKELPMERVEMELGISFEAEGNIYYES